MLLLKIQCRIYSLLRARKITLEEIRIEFFTSTTSIDCYYSLQSNYNTINILLFNHKITEIKYYILYLLTKHTNDLL